MKDQFLIVGGGITGCISAILLANKGASVTLCEASNYLGGILRDQIIDEEVFFSSCQYLSNSEEWFQVLPDDLCRKIDIFIHKYGSVTGFQKSKIISSDFAIPVFAKDTIHWGDFSSNSDNSTLSSRLASYPNYIQNNLIDWVNRYGVNPDLVNGENAIAMQIARINIRGEDEKITKLKKDTNFDAILALSHKKRMPNETVLAALPSNGYNVFLTELESFMRKLNINVLKNFPIKINKNDNKIEFWSRSKQIDSFNLIWAANPNPLLKGLNLPRLDNIYGNSETHFFDVPALKPPVDTIYYQIFSDETDINRIFLYSVESSVRLTVECFAGKKNKNDIELETKKILSEFDFNSQIVWKGMRKDKRYIFFSENDKNILNNLISVEQASNCKIINAGWLDYGRDAKINRIMSQL